MDLKIKDKVFVVNGATGGIGRAVCFALKNEGAKMAISSRCPEKIKALAAELELGPDRLWTTTCDVTDEAQVEALINGAVEHFGHIDSVIPVAGYEGRWEWAAEMSKDNFDEVFGVNVLGVMYMLKHGGAVLAKQGHGSMVVVSSIGALVGSGGMAIYCASKHAAQGLVKSVARELGPLGVNVNSVNPDGVDTPMLDRIGINAMGTEMDKQARYDALVSGTFDKRAATPDEVAYAILYMASPWASHMFASRIVIDGANGAGDCVRP
ncbi:MAG: SDR family oxidoreductase [Oscillospiraceae bacterium]|nr:SDR family oxidoreductase [Oscillospiraceae bacterium]